MEKALFPVSVGERKIVNHLVVNAISEGYRLSPRLFDEQILQHRLQHFPDIGGDDFVAFGGGVDTVGEVEFAHATDIFQDEGDQ